MNEDGSMEFPLLQVVSSPDRLSPVTPSRQVSSYRLAPDKPPLIGAYHLDATRTYHLSQSCHRRHQRMRHLLGLLYLLK